MIQGSAFGTTIYSLTDLGTLGGTSSTGAAINDNGKATGSSTLPGGQTRAFLWDNVAGMQNLGTAGSGDSHGKDINNNDHIVGETGGQAFRWTSSGMVLIDPANNGVANGLNNSNEAVGTRSFPGVNRVIRWNSTNTPTSPFPAANITGVAVNDNNQFVGVLAGTAGLYSNGTGTPQNLGAFIPEDINNDRLVAGSFGVDAAIYDIDSSTILAIGKLNSMDALARALGINNSGVVVGESVGSGGFIYTPTMGMQSLTAMLDSSGVGYNILAAYDINNHDQIVATALFNGQNRAVILTPISIPTGDFDGDGDVDGRDFLLWQRGESPNPHSAEDLAAWQASYGVDSLSAQTAVPEPASGLLALSMIALACLSRWVPLAKPVSFDCLALARGITLNSPAGRL